MRTLFDPNPRFGAAHRFVTRTSGHKDAETAMFLFYHERLISLMSGHPGEIDDAVFEGTAWSHVGV